jgi:hypothetical protein
VDLIEFMRLWRRLSREMQRALLDMASASAVSIERRS